MKFLRPIGQVLAALFIGFNATYLLIAILAMAGGPDLMGPALSLSLSATLLVLFWIVRRSRRKRADAARRAARGQSPPSTADGESRPRTGVLVASALMTLLGLLGGWIALAAEPVDFEVLGWVVVVLALSVPALVSTVQKLRQASKP